MRTMRSHWARTAEARGSASTVAMLNERRTLSLSPPCRDVHWSIPLCSERCGAVASAPLSRVVQNSSVTPQHAASAVMVRSASTWQSQSHCALAHCR